MYGVFNSFHFCLILYSVDDIFVYIFGILSVLTFLHLKCYQDPFPVDSCVKYMFILYIVFLFFLMMMHLFVCFILLL